VSSIVDVIDKKFVGFDKLLKHTVQHALMGATFV
jgi:hypothetical protein